MCLYTMDSHMDTSYDDSVFEQSTEVPGTAKPNTRENANSKNKHASFKNDVDDRADDTVDDSKFFDDEDDTTAVVDTTLDRSTAIPDRFEDKRNTNKHTSNAVDDTGDKTVDNDDNNTDDKSNDDKKPKQSAKMAKTLGLLWPDKSSGIQTETSSRRFLTSLDTSDAPQSRYLRQESDQDSLGSDEFETKHINDPDQTYYTSGFPSLFSHLGPNATNRTPRTKKKKQTSDSNQKLPKTNAQRRDSTSFAQDMKKRNESQWMRIEAVAKEKMDHYERYAVDMTMKIRRQREQINKRSQDLLASLAKLEEKKREDKLYDSPHGRMWRHHRSMQRRAFNLEPMSMKGQGYMSNSSKPEVTDV